MAWYDRFLDLGDAALEAIGDAAERAQERTKGVPAPERRERRAERKAKRKRHRLPEERAKTGQRRELERDRAKREKRAPAPVPEKPGPTLIAGNRYWVALEYERGRFPTKALALGAYQSLLEAGVLGGPSGMMAVYHWPNQLMPFVFYVGHSE